MDFSDKNGESRVRAQLEELAKAWIPRKETGDVLGRLTLFCQTVDSFGLSHEQAAGVLLQTVLPASVRDVVKKKILKSKLVVDKKAIKKVGDEHFVATKGILQSKFFTNWGNLRGTPGFLPYKLFLNSVSPSTWTKQSLNPFPPETELGTAQTEFQAFYTPVKKNYTPVPPPRFDQSSALPPLPNDDLLAVPPGEQQFNLLILAILEKYGAGRVLSGLRQNITKLAGSTTHVRDQCDFFLSQAHLAAYHEGSTPRGNPKSRKPYVKRLQELAYDVIIDTLNSEDSFMFKRRERDNTQTPIQTYDELTDWLEELDSDRGRPNKMTPRGVAKPGGGIVAVIEAAPDITSLNLQEPTSASTGTQPSTTTPTDPAHLQLVASLRVTQKLLEEDKKAREKERARESRHEQKARQEPQKTGHGEDKGNRHSRNGDEGRASRHGGREKYRCFEWEDTGQCQFGKQCRFVHKIPNPRTPRNNRSFTNTNSPGRTQYRQERDRFCGGCGFSHSGPCRANRRDGRH